MARLSVDRWPLTDKDEGLAYLALPVRLDFIFILFIFLLQALHVNPVSSVSDACPEVLFGPPANWIRAAVLASFHPVKGRRIRFDLFSSQAGTWEK